MYFKITVLPGDGIGPEVYREAVRILDAVGNFHTVDFRFEEKPIGGTAIRTYRFSTARQHTGGLP